MTLELGRATRRDPNVKFAPLAGRPSKSEAAGDCKPNAREPPADRRWRAAELFRRHEHPPEHAVAVVDEVLQRAEHMQTDKNEDRLGADDVRRSDDGV